eukprot:TRINITY_DN602_c2_g1_i1.p1 TRINITY_DN602_c2_g1~~TRINITY_DN602_c2_g1_i1.p1  ORF type:complete len:364 (+),score=115.99 TRINITY_DN602_c2_g1_i1:138-1229(+)
MSFFYSVGGMSTFNINDGYLEAICRGYRGGILTQADYNNLIECDTLEDIKLNLSRTAYGDFLSNEPSPLQSTVIASKCTESLVEEFMHIKAQAVEPLATFLDYISYGYMIDNVVLLITASLHSTDSNDIIQYCHKLGYFDNMASLTCQRSVSDLYNSVIVDTPLAPYFQKCLSEEDLDEMNSSVEVEIIRNTLFKAYIEDFYEFCKKLGGTTAEIMCELLEFEADRRSINMTLNAFGTEISKDDRAKLYPNFGKLQPEGIKNLTKLDDDDMETLRETTIDVHSEYKLIFDYAQDNEDITLEDAFYKFETEKNILSFEQQFHYGVFYSYIKLKEQEIRNLLWISECVTRNKKLKINNYIPIFQN